MLFFGNGPFFQDTRFLIVFGMSIPRKFAGWSGQFNFKLAMAQLLKRHPGPSNECSKLGSTAAVGLNASKVKKKTYARWAPSSYKWSYNPLLMAL